MLSFLLTCWGSLSPAMTALVASTLLACVVLIWMEWRNSRIKGFLGFPEVRGILIGLLLGAALNTLLFTWVQRQPARQGALTVSRVALQ